jgi:hypothetical protein
MSFCAAAKVAAKFEVLPRLKAIGIDGEWRAHHLR